LNDTDNTIGQIYVAAAAAAQDLGPWPEDGQTWPAHLNRWLDMTRAQDPRLAGISNEGLLRVIGAAVLAARDKLDV